MLLHDKRKHLKLKKLPGITITQGMNVYMCARISHYKLKT